MRVKSYLIVIIGILICAISFSVFFMPYGIVPSGVAGISIIFNKLYGLDEVITIILLSVMFLIIGCLFLNKKDVKKAILGTILFPLFIYLFNSLFTKIDLSIDNNLLTSIVGGVSLGFGLGLVYREDHYIGGIDIFNCIIDRNIDINYSYITLFTDSLVVIVGGIIGGTGVGIILSSGACTGGTDIVGLTLAKKNNHFSVGRLGLIVNIFIYLVAGIRYGVNIMIYSIIIIPRNIFLD